MATLKILHTADWQLGKPFGGFPSEVSAALGEARLEAIDRIASTAMGQGAKHVVVAGDVFDNVDPGDRVVMQALTRMERADATWWLMPGNHDHARPGGLWSRVRRLAPDRVRVLDRPEAVEMHEGAWLLPAPLEHRKTASDPTAIMVNMATPPGALRIGLAHGSTTEFGAAGESSNLIPPDRARSAGLDYLALGDWHGLLTIGDRTAYSGTPEVDRFGREEPGACIAVGVMANDAPEIRQVGLANVTRAGLEECCGDLSRGTQEQLAILTRLAFADLLLEDGAPISLILDDPLVYSDDARLEVMTNMLQEASARMQVILLTCRSKAFRHVDGNRIMLP